MIKSSSKGRLKGSLIIPQAKSSDTIHIGSIHCIVNIKTGFPATYINHPIMTRRKRVFLPIPFQERKTKLTG